MSTEAITQGHAAAAGKPTSGMSGAETSIAPTEISTVVASGSSPFLIAAFQPAWQAAANSTAAKTNGSIGPLDHRPACPGDVRLIGSDAPLAQPLPACGER